MTFSHIYVVSRFHTVFFSASENATRALRYTRMRLCACEMILESRIPLFVEQNFLHMHEFLLSRVLMYERK